jgi:type I restriction enzyme M protein
MITGELKSRIDKLWLEFHTGGITNPLTVIEQITFLMFARMLDITETRNEKKAGRTNKPFKHIFEEHQQHLRWQFMKQRGADQMLPLVRDEVFPHFKSIAELDTVDGAQKTTFKEYFKDAQLMIQKPSLLVSAVNMIDELPLTEGDTKGDLYEYLLGKLTTAGINGQFRTPRHIIRLMVELLDPKPTETVADPACGTGGFLVGVMEHLLRQHTSPEGIIEHPVNGHVEKTYSGDLLEAHWQHIRTRMFHGFDFDATMLRIAAMNLLLHGVDAPDIHYQDTLSSNFTDKFPEKASNGFDLILANPPFKGSLDEEDVHPTLLRKVKTKKTELLFIALILRMLKNGGRCAVVVPDGVLFGSSKAHQALRQYLVEENQLEGVISLPSGVFKPYAGVSTAILIFTKGGRTDGVFFYHLQDDGFSLDDKRTPLYDSHYAGDLPDALARWKARSPIQDTDRSAKAFFVSAKVISESKFDLSINRYKEAVYQEESFDPPMDILVRMKNLEKEILRDMEELEAML